MTKYQFPMAYRIFVLTAFLVAINVTIAASKWEPVDHWWCKSQSNPCSAEEDDFGRLGAVSGTYGDPNHPDCPRAIQQELKKPVISINGYDAEGGEGVACTQENAVKWPEAVSGTVDEKTNTLVADFSPKGGPSNLKGTWNNTHIQWEDGNYWFKLCDQPANKCE